MDELLTNKQVAQVLREEANVSESLSPLSNDIWVKAMRTRADELDPPPKPEPVFPTDWNCVIERPTGNIRYDDALVYLSHNPDRSRRAKRTIAPDGTITIKPIEA